MHGLILACAGASSTKEDLVLRFPMQVPYMVLLFGCRLYALEICIRKTEDHSILSV